LSGALASLSELCRKPLQLHELKEPRLDRQFQLPAQQAPVDIALEGLDHRIPLQSIFTHNDKNFLLRISRRESKKQTFSDQHSSPN
jgi:hypothetical protein